MTEYSIEMQLAVRQALMAFYEALYPTEMYDPADDPRREDPAKELVRLFGDEKAKGIMEALEAIQSMALIDAMKAIGMGQDSRSHRTG